jgi:hypothetical protein
MVLASKQEYIECSVVFHLDVLKCQFGSWKLDENLIENADETHFMFKNDEHVKYVDVISSGVGMTMVVKVIGRQGAKVIAPFKIQSQNIQFVKYLIIFPCDSYHSAISGFMTFEVFALWLDESTNLHNMYKRQKYIYVDNYVGHNTSLKAEASLLHLNVIVWNVLPNSTHLCQLSNLCVILKIRDAWTKCWKQKKL